MYLSIILPCFNEGKKLQNNMPKIIDYVINNIKKEFEIIIVNDGSTDDTKKYLYEINKSFKNYIDVPYFKNLEIISYKKNRGKGHAINIGLKAAHGIYSIFMDTDLSTDLSAIKDSLFYLECGYDCVIGSRKLKDSVLPVARSPFRKALSTFSTILSNIIVPLFIIDTQCGFKAFKTDVLKKYVLEKQIIDKFAFDVEYLYILKLNNIKIKEIPVIWTDDFDSRVGKLSSLYFILDLFRIRKNKEKYKI